MELKDLKEQLNELVTLLQQSEAQRKELVKEQKIREQAGATPLNTSSALVRFNSFYQWLAWACVVKCFKSYTMLDNWRANIISS